MSGAETELLVLMTSRLSGRLVKMKADEGSGGFTGPLPDPNSSLISIRGNTDSVGEHY